MYVFCSNSLYNRKSCTAFFVKKVVKWCNYYYVPTIFYEEKKLYEASPKEDYAACKKNVKAALDVVCSMWCLEEDR